GAYIYADYGDPGRNALHLDQQVLGPRLTGLPRPEFYLDSTGDFPSHREAYRTYVASTLARAGVDRAEGRALDILALETRLAGAQWPGTKLRDRAANYHPMSRRELELYAPGFPW